MNSPHVIHETIDGEVIVINLASGNYYSVKGAGADVWDVIESSPGADQSTIASAVAERFGRESDEVAREIAGFLEALQREELVAAAENGAAGSVPSVNGVGGGEKTFEPPLLEKYTDMQDLVLLDPVHEVDSTGWPAPKPDATAA
ncbi:MAG TPA: PqqD family protein [Gaiellaceae bacterium]|nr:PqqD family protein [Gaiellaceae bacterium]